MRYFRLERNRDSDKRTLDLKTRHDSRITLSFNDTLDLSLFQNLFTEVDYLNIISHGKKIRQRVKKEVS